MGTNWDELSTFYQYPLEIRKLIHTINMIESYHCQLRKVTKGKSRWVPTKNALSRYDGYDTKMDRKCAELEINATASFLSILIVLVNIW